MSDNLVTPPGVARCPDLVSEIKPALKCSVPDVIADQRRLPNTIHCALSDRHNDQS